MKINSVDGTTYDGVFFFPAVDDDGDDVMTFNFWSFDGKYANKESVEATDIGNKFLVEKQTLHGAYAGPCLILLNYLKQALGLQD